MLIGILNQIVFLFVLIGVTLAKKNVAINQTKVLVDKKVKETSLKQQGVSCCDSFPCLNGGTCYPTNSGFVCSCPYGITGNICQISKISST